MAEESQQPTAAPDSKNPADFELKEGEAPEETGQAEIEAGVPEEGKEIPESGEQSQKILGKFESQEELAKAYSELEQKHTQTAQEAASNRQIIEELYPSQKEEPVPNAPEGQQPYSPQQYPDESVSALDQLVQARVNERVEGLVEQRTGPVLAELEVAKARAELGQKFDELKPQILQVYEDFPELRRPGNLGRAIRIAQSENVTQTVQAAKKEGQQEATDKIEQAGRAQTESASAGERSKKGALSDESVKEMKASELASMLPRQE